MSNSSKGKWAPKVAAGWGAGAAIGAGGNGAIVNAVLAAPAGPGAVAAAVISGALGAGFGFAGGALGHLLGHRWDDPIVAEQPAAQPIVRSALLFGTVVSLLVSAVLSFSAISFMAAHQESQEWAMAGIAFISGFIPPCLQGVLNNWRNETGTRPSE